MKKLTWQSLGWLMMCLCALTFTACGDDDRSSDNNSGGSPSDTKSKIIGTWEIVSSDIPEEAPVGATFSFSNDGTGYWTYGTETCVFTYTYNSNNQFTKTEVTGNFSSGTLIVSGELASFSFSENGSSKRYTIVLKKTSGGNNTDSNNIIGNWELTSCDEEGAPVGSIYTFSTNGTGTILHLDGGKTQAFQYTYTSNGEFTITPGFNYSMKGHIVISDDIASGTYRWNNESTEYSFIFKKRDDITSEVLPIELHDGETIPEFIKMNPAAYGYEVIEVTVDKYTSDCSSKIRITPLYAYQNDEGFFIPGDIAKIGNVYHTWNTVKSYDLPIEYTFDGLYYLNTGDKYYRIYDNYEQQSILILPATHVVQKVHWLDTNVITLDSSASTYSSFLGYNTTGSIFFDVYDDVNVYSQVSVSYSDSWLTGKVRVAYRKGDTYNNGASVYDATRIAIDYANTKNTGSERTGYINITVTEVDGETYNQTYTIKQSGTSSSPDGPSNLVTGKVTATVKAIGPGVAYDSYASYVNGKTTNVYYEYNPQTGKYKVYGGLYDSNPEANGGKGVAYDAHQGYNSITICYDYYKDYVTKITYPWEIVLHVTLP